MSYEAAAALQAAIYQILTTAPGLSGTSVVDGMPPGGVGGTFILIGPEEASDASDKSGNGADHRFGVSVVSGGAGFLSAKTAAAEISRVLGGATPPLTRGRVVSIRFQKAVARRLDDGDVRRIDLTFRARVEL